MDHNRQRIHEIACDGALVHFFCCICPGNRAPRSTSAARRRRCSKLNRSRIISSLPFRSVQIARHEFRPQPAGLYRSDFALCPHGSSIPPPTRVRVFHVCLRHPSWYSAMALFRPQSHARIRDHAADKEDRGENDRKSHVDRNSIEGTPENEDLSQRVSNLCPRKHVVDLDRRPKRCSTCFIGERKNIPVRKITCTAMSTPSCIACSSLV